MSASGPSGPLVLKSYNIYCLQMFNFDGQEDDLAAYDLSPSW